MLQEAAGAKSAWNPARTGSAHTVVKVALIPLAVAGHILLLLCAAPAAAAAVVSVALEHVVEKLAKLGEHQQRRAEEEEEDELHCAHVCVVGWA